MLIFLIGALVWVVLVAWVLAILQRERRADDAMEPAGGSLARAA
jgi:hypothetical protein